jgi:lipopolysaccharide export LptBFGC system permease protein LptF
MENGAVSTSSKDIIKKLLAYFGLAFLLVFTILAVNQVSLLFGFFVDNKTTFFQGAVLFFYSLPAAIVMAIPFSVCMGFIYGLIKINFIEKIAQNKRNAMPVLILGLIISLLSFVFSDFVLPNSTKNFRKLYWMISTENEIRSETPREMNSLKLLQKIDDMHEDEKTLNLYILEFNKKYSIPFGAMFFTFFALSISAFLKRRLKIGLCISFVSCIVYWALIMYGQNISMYYGKHGALVMWIPNILFLCISIILYLTKNKNKPPASLRAANAKGFNGA